MMPLLPFSNMTPDTIFHQIVRHQIPADIVYEDGAVMVFRDIHPKASTHLLFIAKQEKDFVASIDDLTEATAHVPGLLILAAQKFAQAHGITGYQLKFHVGKGGGQEVFYLHLHFLCEQPIT